MKRLFVFVLIFNFSINSSFAEGIKYSVGPACRGNKVICPSQNEVPTCLALNSKVHIEKISMNHIEKNRYQPTCGLFPNNSSPACEDLLEVDESGKNKIAKDVSLECIEFVKCEQIGNSDKLVATCSKGKIAKCLGGNTEPNCESENVCQNKSVPVCDYIWEASVPSSTYH